MSAGFARPGWMGVGGSPFGVTTSLSSRRSVRRCESLGARPGFSLGRLSLDRRRGVSFACRGRRDRHVVGVLVPA